MKLRSMAIAAALIAAALGGCGSDPEGHGEAPSPMGNDLGPQCTAELSSDANNCGECGNVCGADHLCKAGQCVPGCAGGVVHVSSRGNDASSGCSEGSPKRTVGAALDAARALRLEGHAVHVCEGTYAETGLALDHAVSLRGGYDCATWRRADGFGQQPVDDASGGAHPTILENADAAASGATLNVRGEAVTSAVIIDGLVIRGGGGSRGGGAVVVTSGARPRLADNVIVGGDATDTGDSIGSYGVYVQSGAAPEIARNSIDGGAGTVRGSFGSIGVVVARDAGAPRIHDNRIHGGRGTTTLGIASTGLLLSGQTALIGEDAPRGNVIHGGDGHVLGAAGTGGIGVFVHHAVAVELRENRIEGGGATCVGPCGVHGVSASQATDLVLSANRIYGGDADGPGAGSWGVLIADSAGARLQNNMIHGGGKLGGVANATGIELRGVEGGRVIGNTLFASSGAPSGSGVGVAVTRDARGAVLQNNLALTGRPADVAFLLYACPAGSTLAKLENNVTAGHGANVATSVTTTHVACDTRAPIASVTALEAFARGSAGAAAGASGNARIAASCSGDGPAACAAPAACSGTAPACLRTVVSRWSESDDGYAELAADGWRLRSNAPCAVARGGLALPGLTDDAFGARRSAPVTVGAEEIEPGACVE